MDSELIAEAQKQLDIYGERAARLSEALEVAEQAKKDMVGPVSILRTIVSIAAKDEEAPA